jgi:signal transduction histidine kinase
MIGGILCLAIAAIGASYAGIVIRAAPWRRDNVTFGVLALTDAAIVLWRAVSVLGGNQIVAKEVMVPCSLATIFLALATFEFMFSFPRRPRMPRKWRLLALAWGLVAAAVVIFIDAPRKHTVSWSEIVFFSPTTILVFALGVRAFKQTQDRNARAVIAMLCFRWGFGFFAYFFGPVFDIFEFTMWAETTFATVVSFIIIGTAVLRTELFSLRSTAAEVTTISTIALAVALAGGGAVMAVLRWTEPGTMQNALLVGATLVPLGVASIGRAMYPRLEKNVLAGLDDRRARRLGVQGEPLPPEPEAAIAEASRRIASMADNGKVSWQAAPQIDVAMAAQLASGEMLRTIGCEGGTYSVPALGADGALVGAFHIDGGIVDRDTYLVARDLAARVALAVERADAVNELEGARRLAALGQFAAAIAHDIRTPLTSISMNVQILRRKLELSPDDLEHFDIALEELARLDKSVGEILEFAKPVRLAPQAIDIGEWLEDTTRGLSPVLSEKGVKLQLVPSATLTVNGDPQRLRQVLMNLVDNAADASAPGAAVTVRAKPTDDKHIAIEVEDHGRGIAADDLPRIFEPFFTTRPDGTGLGLAICHKVVRAHGGNIQVRSAPGEGSTFTVLLPAA